MYASGPGTPAAERAASGKKSKAGHSRCSGRVPALLYWVSAESFPGQSRFQHAETGRAGDNHPEPASTNPLLIEAPRPAWSRRTHGDAPAQPGHSYHGAALST